jgi:hypothetical protein
MQENVLFEQDAWAVVEVMGHNTFAGKVSEHVIGGTAFIRVDVPEIAEILKVQFGMENTYPAIPAFTKLIGAGSIYAITPCTERIARQMAIQKRSVPVEVLNFEPTSRRLAIAATVRESYDEDDDRGSGF